VGSGLTSEAVGRGAGRSARRPLVPVLPLAELDNGALVPMSELERVACDCQVTRVVMNSLGVPLDVGQTQRTYKRELRRAIIARDRHCRWPGCTIPASWCDVHHITWFTRGGATSVENGIALCRFHHTTIHNEDIQIGVRPSGHRFRRRNGSLIGESFRDGDSLLAMLDPPEAAARRDVVEEVRRAEHSRPPEP
jgi:hypothetical protein